MHENQAWNSFFLRHFIRWEKNYIDGKKLSQNRSCWTTLIGLSNITFHRIEKNQIEKDKFHLSLSFCFSSSTKLWERSLSRFFCLFGLENSNKRDQEICFFGVFRNNWQMALVVIVSILIFFLLWTLLIKMNKSLISHFASNYHFVRMTVHFLFIEIISSSQ